MKSLGFGLEKIGVAALHRPGIFSLLLLALTVLAISFATNVRFNGNVVSVVPEKSQNMQIFLEQRDNFRNFNRDIAVVVKSPRIAKASGLEDLREMQLELALTDNVGSAITLFSIPEPEPETGALQQIFPTTIESDAQAKDTIDYILKEYPQAQSFISLEENAALMMVALDLGVDNGTDAWAIEAYKGVVEAVESVAPDDFEIFYAGLTPISVTILETLIQDQVKLTLFGLALGAIVAMLFFRNMLAAMVCAFAPVLTAIWGIGVFGLFGVPISYLTTVLPTLALILAYADGIVLYHRWNKLNLKIGNPTKEELTNNLEDAIRKVGPASALTSITTAFAISSFALSTSEALVEFAWIGVFLVSLAFLAVIIGIPVLGHWLIRFNLIRSKESSEPSLAFGNAAYKAFSSIPRLISVVSCLAIFLLFYVHTLLQPDYRITDYLPDESKTLQAERLTNDVFGGRSFVFFMVPTVDNGNMISPANRQRLGEVTRLLQGDFESNSIFSLDILWGKFDEEVATRLADTLNQAPEETKRGYLSKDGSMMLVSMRIASNQSIAETSVLIDQINTSLAKLPYGEEISVTGFPILLATEFSKIINELRQNLLIAVLLGVVLVGVATRSAFFAFAALVPNLFPILLMESIIFMQGGGINVTEVVALTLAFGIAIDNAVHVINVLHEELGSGKEFSDALKNAVIEVAPALGASTLIICISTSVIITSILPILPIIGKLIIAILCVALFTNLIILPANLLTLSRVWSDRKSTERN